MTILEAKVKQENVVILKREYEEAINKLPADIVETFLVSNNTDDSIYRIITVWSSRAALDKMRASGIKPTGVQIFEKAGATPTLSILMN